MHSYKSDTLNFINKITPANKAVIDKAKARVDSLAKPLGSLGKLEDIAIKLSGITGKLKNNVNKKAIVIMCSDNGIFEEGVSSCPQSVTLSQTINFTRGLTGVATLAKENNSDLIVVDVGINTDKKIPNVIDRKIRKSTNNMFKESAMSYEECVRAVNVGFEMATNCKNKEYDIVGVGEMGICNTSTSSAVLSVLTSCDIGTVVGKGAGLTKEAFEKKKFVISESIRKNNPDKEDPIDVLAKVGGFDLAAMTGVFLGCAYYKIPVVIDGFISAVAALAAFKLNPLVRDYLIPSHCSKEVGYNVAMNTLDLEPMLNLDMRLGEGSGCPIAFSVISFACAMMNNMATFDEAEINNDYLDAVKDESSYIV
jgi:nicotinate-nucleotide--dimethylbenzimidazole phosphoribosyltransferase